MSQSTCSCSPKHKVLQRDVRAAALTNNCAASCEFLDVDYAAAQLYMRPCALRTFEKGCVQPFKYVIIGFCVSCG